MKNKTHTPRRLLGLLLAVVMLFSIMPTAFASQDPAYHDPAEHWQTANNRTNELDVNSIVTHETFTCAKCNKPTSFMVFRVPEYTRDSQTAMTRNVKYSDGTMVDGEGKGNILDGTPGKDAYYTGYHWTKAVCENCGTINSNMGKSDYGYGKNVYWLYDCAAEFMEALPETVTYEYADSTYHTVTTKGGEFCVFCFGTRHKDTSKLERHSLETEVLPQPANGRFATVEHCTLCDYAEYSYTTAKAVIADYYGVADGKPHTITVSDLSESGVSVSIRYGNSANSCTLTSAPNYTEEGQYAVYYEITYTYKNTTMTENGVANVWLRDESAKADGSCGCGCGDPDCGCQKKDCGGDCCEDKGCGEDHNFVLLDTVDPSCLTLGYDRWLCTKCGMIEKRDYEAALGHAYQSVLICEATCETDGKALELCSRCGDMKVTATPKGAHRYATHTVAATCTSPGYTVKECSVCGDRQISGITNALPHNYKAVTTPASCEMGGKTVHTCAGCGSSFTTDYTAPLGHSWDKGTKITGSTCTGEGMTEYRCIRCGYHRLEGDAAAGHVPGDPATCTRPQLCTKCGAVITPALGHNYTAEVTEPTCMGMGYTTYTCDRCGDTYKGDYTDAKGHTPSDWIVDEEPTTDSEGKRHKKCEDCGAELESESIPRLNAQAVTDSHGEAEVGGYLVIVTDTDTEAPVMGAVVSLLKDESLTVRLPDGRLLDYADQTTVAVLVKADRSGVPDVKIAVTDKNDNDCADTTDKAGKITVPGTSGQTNDDGKATVGGEDEDAARFTLTVRVIDFETKRPIVDANVTIGRTGRIAVTLPDGEDMDEANRITVIVTDHKRVPQEGLTVTVKSDMGRTEQGETDEAGSVTVPDVFVSERHNAYIVGFPDGTFGPEKNMTRSEAAAIFARILSSKNGDTITGGAKTRFKDVPADAWYGGYVRYLSGFGIVTGTAEDTFSPNKAITRAEFTAMAVRFFEAYGDGDPEIMEQYDGFNDISSGYWAAGYIEDAARHGWVKGYGNGNFGPENNITRAEVVTLVNRLLGRAADQEFIDANTGRMNSFPDISKGHWAYYDVMEAANTHTATVKERMANN